MRESQLEALRKEYPKGTRVVLVSMDDSQAPPIGTKGTVLGVDDIGSIMVFWDNGSSLNVVYGEDCCKKLNSVTTICYGKERIWDTKEDAIRFFIKCLAASEGSERERYLKIIAGLEAGFNVCEDE